MNLFPPGLKTSVNNSMDDLHFSLARDISVIQEIANAVILDDGNFNAFSDRRDNNVTYTAVTSVIPARIKFIDKADAEAQLIFKGGEGKSGGASVFVNQDYGIIRIKVKKEYETLVKNSTKIIVDGESCQVFYNQTRQAIFDSNYSVFYLTRQL